MRATACTSSTWLTRRAIRPDLPGDGFLERRGDVINEIAVPIAAGCAWSVSVIVNGTCWRRRVAQDMKDFAEFHRTPRFTRLG